MVEFARPESKYSSTDRRQVQITDALVLYIASDLVPLSVVESEYFSNLMKILDSRYQLPSRKHLSTKHLEEKSTSVQANLKGSLQNAPSVCLTIDLWSNRQMKGFLGITGHFILDWTMQTVMIACKRFKGRHSAENIRLEYEEAISAYEISEKIMTIVTDNASNMTRAFDLSLPGYVTEKEANKDDDSDVEDDSPDSSEESSSHEDPLTECLPTHSRCYAHSLQLVVKDGLKDASQHLKNVISKASNIVSHVRKSIHATDILEGEKRLQAANATRWNSQLKIIRSVLEAPDEKIKLLDVQQLTAYEKKLLHELCIILTPFEKATNMVQQDNYISASLTVPVTLGLKHQLQHISATYSNKMVTTLKTSIEQGLSHYESDEVYLTAAVLDPRFKLRWCEAEKRGRIEADFIKKASTAIQTHPSEEKIKSPVSKSAKLDDDFFSFMAPVTTMVTQTSSGEESEVKDYLNQPCTDMSSDSLEFWKAQQSNFPVLSTIAARYLAIPASSALVERLFSIAGKLFRPERCLMKDQTFERLMMIKCNAQLSNMKTSD